jgi:GT2 family glycosyltransferase
MTRINIPVADSPEVSVIVVTHNGWEWTERALGALVEHTDEPYELIVVDNASTDGTRERLSELKGAHVAAEAVNRGFGGGANLGALMARSSRLLFLNPDAIVQPGWLPPLLETLDADEDAAAVAPRLLHPDGRLQEAGCMVWGDGAGDTYGDGADPRQPEYRFRRDVDYASAACLLVSASAFRDAGGFDPIYHPAYYEDVDLAMRWRSMGLHVVYQPRSTVVHKRWVSTGPPAGRMDLILRNRKTFCDRWADAVAGRPALPVPANAREQLALRDVACPERVLAVATRSTMTAVAGALSELGVLDRSWRLTLLMLGDEGESGAADELRGGGIEVVGLVGQSDAWLAGRRRHYNVVIADARIPESLVAALLDSQPAAARFAIVGEGGASAIGTWIGQCSLVMCTGSDAIAAVDQPHNGLDVVLLDSVRAGWSTLASNAGLFVTVPPSTLPTPGRPR